MTRSQSRRAAAARLSSWSRSRTLQRLAMILGLWTAFGLQVGDAFADPARRYALIIGNNRGDPSESPLRFAERDAVLFSNVMRQLGAVRAEDLITILGGTAAEVRRAFLELNARIRTDAAHGIRSVLITYYSGHADARGLHLGDSTLSYDELRITLRGSPATVRLLILDGCRSGGLTNVKGGHPTDAFELHAQADRGVEGMVLISSSAASEDSHESDRLRASFFSHHLNNALIGAADANADGRVTLNEAYRYAYQHTLKSSGRTSTLQHPTYAYDLKGRGELVMTDLRLGRQRSAFLELAGPGSYLLLSRRTDGDVIAEIQTKKANVRIVLLPQHYVVQQRGRDHYLEYDVDLAPNTTTSLRRVQHRRVAYAELVRKGDSERYVAHGLYGLAFTRGPVVDDQGVGMGTALQYGLDLRYLSFGLRLRASWARTDANTPGALDILHRELAVGLSVQRFFDFGRFSFGVGLNGELIQHQQSFSNADVPTRSTDGLAVGALLTAQLTITGPWVLQAQGGPITYVFKQSKIEAGAVDGDFVSTPLTGWASLGLGWLF